jgi:hypothetical protein
MGICGWGGCERAAIKRGMCNTHYEALRRTGRITVRRPQTPEERYWSKVSRGDGCWLWIAATSTGGYGRIQWGGRVLQAHRVSYELLVGPIPEGLELDHLCRNRACVNPTHLEPVTTRVNLLRGEGMSARHARATACPKGHDLSGDNVRIRPTGGRQCVACLRAAGKTRAADQKRERAARYKEAICGACGVAFTYQGRPRYMCSDECRADAVRTNARNFQRRKRDA